MMRANLALLICIAALLAGCGGNHDLPGPDPALAFQPGQAAASRATPAVEIFEVKEPDRAGEILIPAVITTEITASILAPGDGMIIRLSGQEGARVLKGEELARTSDEERRVQLRQAELEVNRLQVEELQHEAFVKVNQGEMARQQELMSSGLVSKRDMELAQYKVESAKQELEKARLATMIARTKVEEAEVELEKTIIRAPITGIITHRYVKLGAGVVKNDRLFEVSQLVPLEVKFQIPQTERRQLAANGLVELTLGGGDRAVAQARIRRVDPVLDAASNSIGYLADVISGEGLRPGSAVYVRLSPEATATTFWIPRAAISAEADLRGGMTSKLYVLEGSRCAARIVGIKAVEGDQIEIDSGLAVGDRLIVAPPGNLKAGDQIEVVRN